MSAPTEYPIVVAGRINPAVRSQLDEANERFGVTDGALVRMALERFMPGYLAAQGRTEYLDLFAALGAALTRNPALKPELERLTRSGLRNVRGHAA